MIDFKSLKFGDKVYIAKESNHMMHQNRITMRDANGIEWYRYDRDRFTYEIEEVTYCGKVTFIEEGEIRSYEDRETEYHFKYPDGQIYFEHEYDNNYDTKDWFHTHKEAETRIEELKAFRSK